MNNFTVDYADSVILNNLSRSENKAKDTNNYLNTYEICQKRKISVDKKGKPIFTKKYQYLKNIKNKRNNSI